MKMKRIGLAAAALALVSVSAVAQEHWTEGPVWACNAFRTNPGQFDNYMKWLRSHALVTAAESKKQGLILDSKVFVKPLRDANDYDVLICNLHASYAKALDFSQENEAKSDAITAAHWGTANQDEQANKTAPRLEMRTFVGTTYVREVNLRPAN
jgi:hypothetical protein